MEPRSSSSDSQEWARTAIPFIINSGATVAVATSLRYTDEYFLLAVVTAEIFLIVLALATIAKALNWYVIELGAYSLRLLLFIMLPLYVFHMLLQGLAHSQGPLWFESLAYIAVVLFFLIALVATFATELMDAFSAMTTFKRLKTEKDE